MAMPDFLRDVPSHLAEAARAHAAKADELLERLDAVEGVAETTDGLLRARVNAAVGLAALYLDPRAMRMPSEDLAEAICRVAQQARANLEERTQQVVQDASGEDDAGGPFATAAGRQAKLNELAGLFDGAARDATSTLAMVQKRMRR